MRKFDRDENGTIQILVVVCAMALALMVALIFNTGNQAQKKIQMQNAVDASLISGSKWMARGLNVVSMNNVGMTQTLAVIITLRALYHTFQFYSDTGLIDAIHAGYCAIPFVGWAMCPVLAVAKEIGRSVIYPPLRAVVPRLTDPPPSQGALWYVMDMFQYLNEFTQYATPVLMEIAAWDVAQKNAAEVGILFRAGDGFIPTMPVRRGSFDPDICAPTKYGSPQNEIQIRGYRALYGYPDGQGPLSQYGPARAAKYPTWIWVWAGAPLAYNVAVQLNYYLLCGRSGDARPQPYSMEVPVAPYCNAATDPAVVEIEWSRRRYTLEEVLERGQTSPQIDTRVSGQVCQGTTEEMAEFSRDPQQARRQWEQMQEGASQSLSERPDIDDPRDPQIAIFSDSFTAPRFVPPGTRIASAFARCCTATPSPPCWCDKWQRLERRLPVELSAAQSAIRTQGRARLDGNDRTRRTLVGFNFQGEGAKRDDWLLIGSQVLRVRSISADRLEANFAILAEPDRQTGLLDFVIKKLQDRHWQRVTEWIFVKGVKRRTVEGDTAFEGVNRSQMPFPLLLGEQPGSGRSVVRATGRKLNFFGLALSSEGRANTRFFRASQEPVLENFEEASQRARMMGRLGRSRLGFPDPNVAFQGRFVTYAQAIVFNPTSWDTFTQNWHTKLVKTESLDSLFNLAGQETLFGEIISEFNKH